MVFTIGISIRLTSKTMETLVHLHAGILVIVKRADCHAMTADLNAVQLCRLSGGQVLFDRFKYIHCIFLSGTKKTPDIFTMKTASALQLHILFFLLRGFLLLLIAALLLQELHFFRDGVLRFGLFLDLGLLRREDFADPIANIFHWLQVLLGGGKLSSKLGVCRFQLVIFRLQGIQIDIQIHALFFEIAERFVEAVQLVLVAFCKRCLSSFPADFQIQALKRG